MAYEYDKRGLRRFVDDKVAEAETGGFCGTCVHACDPHEVGADGRYFLCKCRIHKPWSRFVESDTCADYEKGGALDVEVYNF